MCPTIERIYLSLAQFSDIAASLGLEVKEFRKIFKEDFNVKLEHGNG